jgi:tRNA dimethylallyltransferase
LNSSKSGSGKVPVLVLFAPTATGKTALLRTFFAESSLSYFKGTAEIISADSMQVYRGMDIGTAKPDDVLLSDLPHHLINICSPDEQFTVADFVKQADAACAEIYSRGKIPVIAGGTGFYIRAFLLGLPETPEVDKGVRAEIQHRMKTEGSARLYAELQSLDPESAAAIHMHDKYRIQRALEVYETTGKPRSSFKKKNNLREQYFFCTIVLRMEREMLYRRINQRVDTMFQEGLEREVRSLMETGYTADTPGMKAIGYREWFSCDSKKDCTEEDVRMLVKADSRTYAKKQYIYMHNIPSAVIIPFDGSEEAVSLVSREIHKFFDAVK